MNFAAMLAMLTGAVLPELTRPKMQFRSGTPGRKKSRDKTGLPSGYPGAKLARKAIQRRVGVCH